MIKITVSAILLQIIMASQFLTAQVIPMRIPDSTVVSGNNIDIPVYAVNTLTGNNVLSYVLQLNFNQNYLQVISVITAGTISAPFGSPAVNTSIPGQITIAGAGTSSLTGSGKFIYIRFKALQPGGIGINFTGAQNNFFNEGIPSMSFDNGVISISSPPFITVSPAGGIITKGETLQFSVSGGTAPYQWSVTNASVAAINATGLLTGTQAGFTRVFAVDNNGLRDTTNGQVEIRAMRLTIPSNLSQWQGSDIDVPVNTTDLTGLNILSGSLSFSFNQNILTPVGLVQAGTLLATYPAPVFNTAIPGAFAIDFAGTTVLAGSGTLIFIRFHVSTVNTGSTSINFTSGLFNEDLLPNFTNGYFTTMNLPVLSITPNSGTLVAGQTQQFTLNGGGTPPVVWSVSDPAVASISSTGLMTTLKGGNVTVTAVDSHGATDASGNWLVYDTRVLMPDTNTCPAAGEFSYPIMITALPSGESVLSVQASVSYNATYLTFLSLESVGTLTQGWTYVNNPATGQVTFAGSGTTPFNTAGIIVKLKFQLEPSFVVGSWPMLALNSITLNEGIPNPLPESVGYITGVNPNLPVSVTISASANPVFTGTPVTFTAVPVNGGNAPQYQWEVNSSVVTGATNSLFTYIPSNGDAVVCVMTSSDACIINNPAASGTLTMTVNVPVNAAISGNVTLPHIRCYDATNTIAVAGGGNAFTVQSGASVTMIAGQRIDFLPGSRVFPGGYLHGYIAPSGPYCPTVPPNAPVHTGIAVTEQDVPQTFFRVYPNPTTGDLTVEMNREANPVQADIVIYDSQGGKILSTRMNGGITRTLSLSARPAGLYFIRVISGNRVETRKVVRQ